MKRQILRVLFWIVAVSIPLALWWSVDHWFDIREYLIGMGDWEYIDTDAYGNRHYRDRHEVKRYGDIVEYREKIVYGPMQSLQLTQLTGVLTVNDTYWVYLNCKKRTFNTKNRAPKTIPHTYHPMGRVYHHLCGPATRAPYTPVVEADTW